MNFRRLFSLYLQPAARPQSHYRTVKRPVSPYLSQVRPINLEPVRPALEEEPPRLLPASPAMGWVEKTSLCLMVFVATAVGLYMAHGTGRVITVREHAAMARELHRAEAELAAANLARRDLQASLAERIARDSEPPAVRATLAAPATRRAGSHH